MSLHNAGVVAGTISTALFVTSYLPMLVKAARTRDLSSYSVGNLALANAGNLVHTIYVVSLPVGPIWVLHGFYLGSTALMMCWCLRYREKPHIQRMRSTSDGGDAPDSVTTVDRASTTKKTSSVRHTASSAPSRTSMSPPPDDRTTYPDVAAETPRLADIRATKPDAWPFSAPASHTYPRIQPPTREALRGITMTIDTHQSVLRMTEAVGDTTSDVTFTSAFVIKLTGKVIGIDGVGHTHGPTRAAR